MKKRILLTLLAFTLIVSAVAVTALADEQTPDLKFENDGTTPYVSEITGKTFTISNISKISKISYKTGDTEGSKTLNNNDRLKESYTVEGLVEGAEYQVAITYMRDTTTTPATRYTISNYVTVQLVSLVDNGAKWPKPEGLSVVNNRLSGYDSGIEYEYVRFNPLITPIDEIDDTDYAPVNVRYTDFTAGLWAVRRVAGDNGNEIFGASDPVILYSRGADVGTIHHVPTKGSEYESHTGGFLPGYWTTYAKGTYIDRDKFTAGGEFTAENAHKMGFMYQFTNDEILPIAELNSFSFSLSSAANNNNYFQAPYDSVLRIYVAGADVEYYDINVPVVPGTLSTFNVSNLWREAVAENPNFVPEGYVLGFRIFMFNPAVEDNAVVIPGDTLINYLQISFGGVSGSSIVLDAKKSLDLGDIKTLRAVIGYNAGDFTDCGEIIGLDPYATYQIAPATPSGNSFIVSDDDWIGPFTGVSSVPVPAGPWAVRVYATATDAKYVSTEPAFVVVQEADPNSDMTSARVPKVLLPEDVTYADVEYIFDIDQTHWINRLTIENILTATPDATIVFKADDYKFTVKASDIDLSLSNAHYFDMKVTFDGESEYDRVYDKMAALADENELVRGIHFESTTGYFFDEAVFEVNLGAALEGMEVDLRSYNERVNRLRSEETVVVDDGWATFSSFGADYIIVSSEWAEAKAE